MIWDKIAKTGTFTDMNGNKRTLTTQIFEEIVNNYKNPPEKAPAVFGHPKTPDAAQAWVGALRVNGDYLEASYEQIKPDARADLEAKKYRYKSMSYDPATNTLKHVGWLGAVPPAISGLGEIAFAESDDDVTLYFSEYFNVKDFENVTLKGDKMEEKALAMVAEAHATVKEKEKEIEKLEEELGKAEAEKKEAEAEIEKAKGETEEVKAEFAKYKAEIVQSGRVKRVDALVESGRLQPADREKVLAMAATLGSNTEASFASHDGSKITAEEQYLRDLEGAGGTHLFSEFSAPAGVTSGGQPQAVSGKQMVTKL